MSKKTTKVNTYYCERDTASYGCWAIRNKTRTFGEPIQPGG